MTPIFSTVLLAALFFAPGYLANWVRCKLVIRKKPSGMDLFYESIVASIFVQLAFLSGLWIFSQAETTIQRIANVTNHGDWSSPPFSDIWGLTINYFFLLPLALVSGILYAILDHKRPIRHLIIWLRKRSGIFNRFVIWLTLPVLNDWNSEWDRIFNMSPQWVFVTLRDGTRYRGIFDGATTYPDPHELVLREVTTWGKDTNTQTSPAGDVQVGYSHVWISGDQIKSILVAKPPSSPLVAEAEEEASPVSPASLVEVPNDQSAPAQS